MSRLETLSCCRRKKKTKILMVLHLVIVLFMSDAAFVAIESRAVATSHRHSYDYYSEDHHQDVSTKYNTKVETSANKPDDAVAASASKRWIPSCPNSLHNRRMAYVDQAFSISDEDILEESYVVHNRPPVKEIALAISMLVFGTLGIVLGLYMAAHKIGGDTAHGAFFAGLGSVIFLPGFYYTRIAYYAYKGYKGFSFSNIPPV